MAISLRCASLVAGIWLPLFVAPHDAVALRLDFALDYLAAPRLVNLKVPAILAFLVFLM